VRRSGRSMNRKGRDRGAGMRLTERTRKLIPETRRGVPKGAISYTQGGYIGLHYLSLAMFLLIITSVIPLISQLDLL